MRVENQYQYQYQSQVRDLRLIAFKFRRQSALDLKVQQEVQNENEVFISRHRPLLAVVGMHFRKRRLQVLAKAAMRTLSNAVASKAAVAQAYISLDNISSIIYASSTS